MSTKSLDELYEVLKERRRLGKPQGPRSNATRWGIANP